MKAAIYNRVSTSDQERDGTSLESQKDACLKKAKELGYEVPESLMITEIYSGLSIERPKLDQLRELVRAGEVDAVIAYTLDRLSRDPVHCIILQDEFERYMVELILVTESIDTSDMGKLIVHIKGFAAKLEAEKIRERTQRGIRERVKAGRMPSGRRARLYGYTYIPGKGVGQGIRQVNQAESKWVKQIFDWFVNDGIGIDRIAYKLRDLGIQTPSGKGIWYASEVWRILRNCAYIGKTYVYTQTYGLPKKRLAKGTKTKKTGMIMRPREQWMEIPDATPPIIDKRIFEMAQAQLKRNKERSSRNRKQQYLLSDHIKCKRCGRNYWGYVKKSVWGKKVTPIRYYHCSGKYRMVSPKQCDNPNLNAGKIEGLIWGEVKKLLTDPKLILSGIETLKESQQDSSVENELPHVQKELITLDKDQQQLLQWALKGFPEEAVNLENTRINNQRVKFKSRMAELTKSLQTAKQDEIDITRIEDFCNLAVENIDNFSYEDKRMALEALHIFVQVDGNNISVTGTIPMETGVIDSPLPA